MDDSSWDGLSPICKRMRGGSDRHNFAVVDMQSFVLPFLCLVFFQQERWKILNCFFVANRYHRRQPFISIEAILFGFCEGFLAGERKVKPESSTAAGGAFNVDCFTVGMQDLLYDTQPKSRSTTLS